ncbi:MAG: FixH family protein [Nitrospiraceae bacterium]|nr:FixH family protein [Nitrospiraceae bacterium]
MARSSRTADSFTALALVLFLFPPYALAAGKPVIKADCQISEHPCTKTTDGLTATLEITPRPVRDMRELVFTVFLSQGSKAVTDAKVAVDLTMPDMIMGQNLVRMAHKMQGIYAGKGVIVRCPSGKKLWRAEVRAHRGKKTIVVPFLFEVR